MISLQGALEINLQKTLSGSSHLHFSVIPLLIRTNSMCLMCTSFELPSFFNSLTSKDRVQCELDDCISSFESAVNFLPKHLHLATDALKEAIILAINASEFLLPL